MEWKEKGLESEEYVMEWKEKGMEWNGKKRECE